MSNITITFWHYGTDSDDMIIQETSARLKDCDSNVYKLTIKLYSFKSVFKFKVNRTKVIML